MNQLIEVLISGITISSTYALVAIGLSLVYGVSKIFNYAYGSLITLGAYSGWFLFSIFSSMNYLMAFLIVIPFMLMVLAHRCQKKFRKKWSILYQVWKTQYF